MYAMRGLVAVGVLAAGLAVAVGADEADGGAVYVPRDGKSFTITARDVVRFTGPAPGSTGIQTAVTVTAGAATVTQRKVFVVTNGQPLKIGGGSLEFDVRPAAGKTGTVKVKVTTTPPGKPATEKEYEFEVK